MTNIVHELSFDDESAVVEVEVLDAITRMEIVSAIGGAWKHDCKVYVRVSYDGLTPENSYDKLNVESPSDDGQYLLDAGHPR